MSFDQFKTTLQTQVQVNYEGHQWGHSVSAVRPSSTQTKHPAASDPPLVVSVDEARRLLSIGRTSIFDLIRTNELSSFKRGRRRLILRTSIEAFIERRVADERSGQPG